ncbi:hypothetical protein ACHAWF_000616 [Thalassiosira exigua]
MIYRAARGFICAVLAVIESSAFAPTIPVDVGLKRGSQIALHLFVDPVTPVTAAAASDSWSILHDFDHHTSTRLPYSPAGYLRWKWKYSPKHQEIAEDKGFINSDSKCHVAAHSINYLEMGDSSKPALVLVHGFGASSYHFRHNIPALARKYHVFALDLLGFGWSDKPVMDYDANV